ncbi:branched-chain amino acid ABC transporter permease [Halorubrum ezzemoulense]|jgi:branched-chain amino acid transport system permease protein|uniref:Amino acid/amide ABC transporter membrane protein 1, HAAT family n=7 Tax=Halorubrum TaxID=56688 RepID=A0A256KVU7_HALEZ|nr:MULTISPECIES: branched-chain amino acid ABC transporter permease [Halorubrum]PHQ46887.1 branched-chain amino acid ABC transporter permease [Halorubrum sp. C3]ELZ35903.1 inner-membrane translocator [Halorubrum terrestre JCM 10247]ELZ50674.1 inner-membrane translocator [Halorubrum distributum JCM 9100]ELZ52901.1 inner-membrane translocator [Halorubrum distributum JCM 10118]EMA63496.1 inner-membrane translocator [Halorubrum litoreum JCM 13561]
MTVLGYLANGLVFSSIIVLGSIGLSLVYSIADFANFAHGDTMTIGAYSALVTFGAVGGLGGAVLGLPYGFFLALVVGIAVAAVVAVATEKLIYEPLDVDSIGLLITSIGIAFIYRAVIQIRFGSDFTRFDVRPLRPIEALVPYGVRITLHDVAIFGSAVALVVGLHVLLQYTDLGRKMRAMADNPDLARVSGIRTKRVKLWTWVIGAGLAGAGGVFLGLFNQLAPRMGFNLLLVIFAAVILGGIGSVYGAMAGGFLIGMINQLTPFFSNVVEALPIRPNWLATVIENMITIEYANAIAFVIMVVVLLVRPNGIAGEGAT